MQGLLMVLKNKDLEIFTLVMLQKFLNDAKRYYEAGLEEVDFKKKSEAARVNINKWVEKKTQGENQNELILNFKLTLQIIIL